MVPWARRDSIEGAVTATPPLAEGELTGVAGGAVPSDGAEVGGGTVGDDEVAGVADVPGGDVSVVATEAVSVVATEAALSVEQAVIVAKTVSTMATGVRFTELP